MRALRTVPVRYRGVQFRSTLEANWAATLDRLGIYWQYEPVAIKLHTGTGYLCDFYLPTQRVWAEVKGPHNERIAKVAGFHELLGPDPWDVGQPMVVILRAAGPGDVAVWSGVTPSSNIIIAHCPQCDGWVFMDTEGAWQCRRCFFGNHPKRHDNKFWMPNYYRSGELRFSRIPPDVKREGRIGN